MAYNKYYLQKKQVSYDNGLTWEDVTPSETRQGDYIASYETLSECEGIIDYSTQYLTFESKSNNNSFSFTTNTIEYSLDDGSTWSSLTTGNSVTINSGETICWKASGLSADSSNGIGRFSSTEQYEVKGNAMSLVSGDSFETASTISEYQFRGLFSGSTGLTSAENLVLPSTTLADSCYLRMFYNCYSLTTVPELPATTLANSCYAYMFRGCSSLTTAPVLSATTLALSCYNSMFSYCTSLINAPELPATTLANYCYGAMFSNCTSLTVAPELPATTLATYCYGSMFNACTSLTVAPELPATTLSTQCYIHMFRGCSSLTTAPELPAPTLVGYCYQYMFNGCTSLNYIKCLATNPNDNIGGNVSDWTTNVASTGTFVKDANTTWQYGIPSNWTVQNNS